MTLTQLQVLVAVVETGSLTAAADKLHRTQSAVSHALTQLEEAAGLKLVARDCRPIRLTPAGGKLWQGVLDVIRAAENLRQRLAVSRGRLEGRLIVGSLPSVSLKYIAPAIARMQEMHGGVATVMLEGTDDEVKEWIEQGVVDVGVVADAGGRSSALLLLEDRFVAIAPKCGMLEPRRSVSPAQLAVLPFVLSKSGCAPALLRYFSTNQAALNPKFEVIETRTILAMVEGGLGVSAVPETVLHQARFSGRVLRMKPPLRRSVALVARDDGNAIVGEFLRIVTQIRNAAVSFRGGVRMKRPSGETGA